MKWFGWKSRNKKQAVIDNNVKALANDQLEQSLTLSIEENRTLLESMFENDDTIKNRIIQSHDQSVTFYITFCENLVNTIIINEHIIKALLESTEIQPCKDLMTILIDRVLRVNGIEQTDSLQEIELAISCGKTILLTDGLNKALILSTKSFETRAISEPESEKILSGPREGFAESLSLNLSLIKRKVRTSQLKMKYYYAGERTNTQMCICYIESLVNQEILQQLYKRLDKVKIDGVLDSHYIVELIKDEPYSVFRTTGYTERPDVVVGKLLEGRIALLVDGSPVAMTLPYLFIENFQSSEDYYLNFFYSSFSRLLRILGFFMTVIIPGAYVAIVAFHREMLPAHLLHNIAIQRQSVPLPAAVEALVMLLVFDILRETGIRMPTNVGQALSIVGALVLGQAAVEAKLVAAPMIIIVAITGITSLLIPKMNTPAIFFRMILLLMASSFGFFGLFAGFAIMLIHLLNLRSFGIPQITLSGQIVYQDIKDIVFRAPWWQMVKRPAVIAAEDERVRMQPPSEEKP